MQSQSRDVYTFCGETCIMPKEVLHKAQNELLNWNGIGIGVMEMSHRSPEYAEINSRCNNQLRELLSVPENYKILLMQGGATLQYAAIPMNILQTKNTANYLVSGFASNRAYDEFKKYGEPNLVAPPQNGFTSIPNKETWQTNAEGAYFYYTDNETANGLEFKTTPDVGPQELVCDMTSSLSTKQIDISKYGVVFASAQKNLGPAGVTVVVIRNDLIGRQRNYTPNMFNWKTTLDTNSIFNTAPCFAVYATGLYVDYLLRSGGVAKFEDLAERRSKVIYDVIDSSHGFYRGTVTEHSDRSRLNATFLIGENGRPDYLTVIDSTLQDKFREEAHQQGLLELKGHPSVGGLRISMYNGMPLEGVEKLRDFMVDFQEKHLQQ